MAKFTILLATPYPEEAVNPKRLTKAQSARKESCVKNSYSANGSPSLRNFLHWELIRKSALLTENGRKQVVGNDE